MPMRSEKITKRSISLSYSVLLYDENKTYDVQGDLPRLFGSGVVIKFKHKSKN